MASIGSSGQADRASHVNAMREALNVYDTNIDEIETQNDSVDTHWRNIDLATKTFDGLGVNRSAEHITDFSNSLDRQLDFYDTINTISTLSKRVIDQLGTVIAHCKTKPLLENPVLEHLDELNSPTTVEQLCLREDAFFCARKDLEEKQTHVVYLNNQLLNDLTPRFITALGTAFYALGVAKGEIGRIGTMRSNEYYFDEAKSRRPKATAAEPTAAPTAQVEISVKAPFVRPPVQKFASIEAALDLLEPASLKAKQPAEPPLKTYSAVVAGGRPVSTQLTGIIKGFEPSKQAKAPVTHSKNIASGPIPGTLSVIKE